MSFLKSAIDVSRGEPSFETLLAQSSNARSWVTPRSRVMGSNLVRPGDFNSMPGWPPALCWTTSVDRRRPLTLSTPATYWPSHLTLNLKLLYGSRRMFVIIDIVSGGVPPTYKGSTRSSSAHLALHSRPERGPISRKLDGFGALDPGFRSLVLRPDAESAAAVARWQLLVGWPGLAANARSHRRDPCRFSTDHGHAAAVVVAAGCTSPDPTGTA